MVQVPCRVVGLRKVVVVDDRSIRRDLYRNVPCLPCTADPLSVHLLTSLARGNETRRTERDGHEYDCNDEVIGGPEVRQTSTPSKIFVTTTVPETIRNERSLRHTHRYFVSTHSCPSLSEEEETGKLTTCLGTFFVVTPLCRR